MKYFFYFAEVILIGVLNNYYGLFALRAAFFFFTAIQPGFFFTRVQPISPGKTVYSAVKYSFEMS